MFINEIHVKNLKMYKMEIRELEGNLKAAKLTVFNFAGFVGWFSSLTIFLLNPEKSTNTCLSHNIPKICSPMQRKKLAKLR